MEISWMGFLKTIRSQSAMCSKQELEGLRLNIESKLKVLLSLRSLSKTFYPSNKALSNRV
jgi:hypothetical protein